MANEALSAITSQIVSQSFAAKSAAKRRATRLTSLTQSFTTLGLQGDKAGAAADLLLSGRPLSASEMNNLMAEQHREELEALIPESISTTGLTAGAIGGIAELTVRQQVVDRMQENEMNDRIRDVATGKEVAKGGDLLNFPAGQPKNEEFLQLKAIAQIEKLFPSLSAASKGLLLTGRLEPGAAQRHGVLVEIWEKMEFYIGAGATSAEDLKTNFGNQGVLDSIILKKGLGITSDAELDDYLGLGRSGEQMYALGQKVIASNLDNLLGQFNELSTVLLEWESLAPDPNDKSKLVSLLSINDPIMFRFVTENLNPDGSIRGGAAISTGRVVKQIIDIENKLQRLHVEQRDEFLKVLDDLASRPESIRNLDGWRTTLERDYGWDKDIIDYLFDLLERIYSGQVSPRVTGDPRASLPVGSEQAHQAALPSEADARRIPQNTTPNEFFRDTNVGR